MVPLPCEAAADPPPAAATNIIANKTALMSRSPRQGRDERRGQRREGAPRQRAVVVLPRMEAGPKIAEDATREQSHRAGIVIEPRQESSPCRTVVAPILPPQVADGAKDDHI